MSNKYKPLKDYLLNYNKSTVTLSFREIENIIHSKLPPTAYERDVFWNNNNRSIAQTKNWLEAGYIVVSKKV